MSRDLIDTRRLFRNRFERFVDTNDSTASTELDGSPLTLRDLCVLLAEDAEPFPSRYNTDMRKLCSHEHLHWFRKERSYGHVTRVLGALLTAEDAGLPRPGGFWLRDILKARE